MHARTLSSLSHPVSPSISLSSLLFASVLTARHRHTHWARLLRLPDVLSWHICGVQFCAFFQRTVVSSYDRFFGFKKTNVRVSLVILCGVSCAVLLCAVLLCVAVCRCVVCVVCLSVSLCHVSGVEQCVHVKRINGKDSANVLFSTYFQTSLLNLSGASDNLLWANFGKQN